MEIIQTSSGRITPRIDLKLNSKTSAITRIAIGNNNFRSAEMSCEIEVINMGDPA
jgi:hypothetical protein